MKHPIETMNPTVLARACEAIDEGKERLDEALSEHWIDSVALRSAATKLRAAAQILDDRLKKGK